MFFAALLIRASGLSAQARMPVLLRAVLRFPGLAGFAADAEGHVCDGMGLDGES